MFRGGVTLMILLLPSVSAAQFLSVRPATRETLPSSETAVDDVAAAVEIEGDDRPPIFVLRSEVDLAMRFELAARGQRIPPAGQLAAVSRSMLEQVIGERLLEREAARALDPEPTTDALEEEHTQLASRVAPAGGINGLIRSGGFGPGDFDKFVRRRLIVGQFLERHLLRSVEPTRAELRAAYDEERIAPYRAQNVPFQSVRADIRAVLIREGYARAIQAYLRSIGSRARVRLWTEVAEPDAT